MALVTASERPEELNEVPTTCKGARFLALALLIACLPPLPDADKTTCNSGCEDSATEGDVDSDVEGHVAVRMGETTAITCDPNIRICRLEAP